jgi:hypothetical protein
METKVCSKCKRELPLEAFGKCRSSKDGLKHACKECRNADKRKYNATHKQQAHEYKLWYRKTHKEEIKEKSKIYKNAHREEIRQKGRIYYSAHKEHYKNYREENREEIAKNKKIYYREIYSSFCKKGEEEKILHYEKAKADNFKGWVRHHRLETHTSDGFLRLVQLSKTELIALDMYYERPAEELIWLKAGVHRTVHGKAKKW